MNGSATFLSFKNGEKTETYKFELQIEAEIIRLIYKATKASKDESISLYVLERK